LSRKGGLPLATDCNRKLFTTIFDHVVVTRDRAGSNLQEGPNCPTASDQNDQSVRHGLIKDNDAD
jgi:hypothetical protein